MWKDVFTFPSAYHKVTFALFPCHFGIINSLTSCFANLFACIFPKSAIWTTQSDTTYLESAPQPVQEDQQASRREKARSISSWTE